MLAVKKVAEVKVTWLILKTFLAPLLFEIFQVHLVTVLIFPSQNMMKPLSKNWITRQYADVVRPGENPSFQLPSQIHEFLTFFVILKSILSQSTYLNSIQFFVRSRDLVRNFKMWVLDFNFF